MSELELWVAGAVVLGAFVWWRWPAIREAQRILDGPDGDIGPPEPCWTDEIGSDGRYLYSRGQCVNDALMAEDARVRREEQERYGAG